MEDFSVSGLGSNVVRHNCKYEPFESKVVVCTKELRLDCATRGAVLYFESGGFSEMSSFLQRN